MEINACVDACESEIKTEKLTDRLREQELYVT